MQGVGAGKHYYALEGKDKRTFLTNHPEFQDGLKNARTIYLWTEKGAFLHAKSQRLQITHAD
jgi:hypothetical protein